MTQSNIVYLLTFILGSELKPRYLLLLLFALFALLFVFLLFLPCRYYTSIHNPIKIQVLFLYADAKTSGMC